MKTAQQLLGELSQLWHTSRVACSGVQHHQYARKLWTAKEFSKANPIFTPTAAYKAIDRMTVRLPASNDPETLKFLNRVIDDAEKQRNAIAPTLEEYPDPRQDENEPIAKNE